MISADSSFIMPTATSICSSLPRATVNSCQSPPGPRNSEERGDHQRIGLAARFDAHAHAISHPEIPLRDEATQVVRVEPHDDLHALLLDAERADLGEARGKHADDRAGGVRQSDGRAVDFRRDRRP